MKKILVAGMSKDSFTEKIFETFGKDTFMKLETNPPNTRELKDPQLYLNRIK